MDMATLNDKSVLWEGDWHTERDHGTTCAYLLATD